MHRNHNILIVNNTHDNHVITNHTHKTTHNNTQHNDRIRIRLTNNNIRGTHNTNKHHAHDTFIKINKMNSWPPLYSYY